MVQSIRAEGAGVGIDMECRRKQAFSQLRRSVVGVDAAHRVARDQRRQRAETSRAGQEDGSCVVSTEHRATDAHDMASLNESCNSNISVVSDLVSQTQNS